MISASEIFIAAQHQIKLYRDLINDDELQTFDDMNLGESEQEQENTNTQSDNDEEIEATEEIENVIEIADLEYFGYHLPCSSHTLQLCAKAVISTLKENIKPIHNFASNSRKPMNAADFAGMKKPPLPCETRWDSEFMMVKCIYDNKQQYKQVTRAQIKLKTDDWMFIDEYYESFRHIHDLMLKTQSDKLFISEYFN
jgi:hypothetical protein